ncbi:aminodeoxychorismate/anthranilate synthase component II [Pullulanibacillus sp. KACC 23026]|uniref:aminodeoxychorismate/anthranilate synthase component II n=1 Tax=Pullulanibacillus sp. KACC 23026 TaxID=3028315 RepID=UPI0023B00B79|nr:aminodeoxychorismate/anthranilate synthase component II [Pullulanibacillus sp. KACC 23026]WEG12709.1 aminodeoxychorismate/anthranilate synthase component II [Pullulanibacillus sp. KACC 23026]
MILIIDNYDSFTYNLVQYFGEMGEQVEVIRNDELTVDELADLQPDYLVLSPGPCTPNEAGITLEAIEAFGGKVPILGVCLGHQSIGQAFGGQVIRASRLMHGKTSPVFHSGHFLFNGIDSPFEAMRYHSLIVEESTLPDCLEVTAWTEENEIMALRHKTLPIEGVQFHPEAILTKTGKLLLKNFLEHYSVKV